MPHAVVCPVVFDREQGFWETLYLTGDPDGIKGVKRSVGPDSSGERSGAGRAGNLRLSLSRGMLRELTLEAEGERACELR